MNLTMPKSLTATVHVRFNYEEAKSNPHSEDEIEILNKLMDQAAEMSPELQELLVRFADYVNKVSPKFECDGQSPT